MATNQMAFVAIFLTFLSAIKPNYANYISTKRIETNSSSLFLVCPSNPLTLCDFYFRGNEYTVPTINLDQPPHTPVSPPLMDAKTGAQVEVESTGAGRFLCPNEIGNSNTRDQFFFSLTKLQFHPLLVASVATFQDQCILLPLDNLYLKATNQNLNMYQGDNVPGYPLSRRCVVFKTGPSGPPESCQYTPPLLMEEVKELVSDPFQHLDPTECPKCKCDQTAQTTPTLPQIQAPAPVLNAPPQIPDLPPPLPAPLLKPSPALKPSPSPTEIKQPPTQSMELRLSKVIASECSTDCPQSPAELCSLYFLGFRGLVPTFDISDTVIGKPISPPIYFNGSSVAIPTDSDYRQHGSFLQCPLNPDIEYPGNQFYAEGGLSHLYARMFQNYPGKKYFKGRCLKLNVGQIGVMIRGVAHNVPPNSTIAAERLCVIFRIEY